MPQPISVLNLFTTYGTREAYESDTGKVCPPWNKDLPPKRWFDPNAKKSFTVNGVPYALYPNVYESYDQVTEQPIWGQLGISVDQAKSVNIPPTGTGSTNVPGADEPEVPCPCRGLKDNEVIKLAFGGIPRVYTTEELQDVQVGFCQSDRDTLERIAAKLGV